jgi:hypothetical protein
MPNKKYSLGDLLMWAALGVILLWAVLKSLGIIKSPVWQEMVPVFGAVYVMGRIAQVVSDTKKDVGVVKGRVQKMAVGLTRIETKFERIESGCKLFSKNRA